MHRAEEAMVTCTVQRKPGKAYCTVQNGVLFFAQCMPRKSLQRLYGRTRYGSGPFIGLGWADGVYERIRGRAGPHLALARPQIGPE
ncbi:unnamed protein product [Bursaphelenchus xylophilus]|uniref:(pine wood nematode) hypothetical protein n=1 Tax=Bursaphelenchus xylophilus TaxID=6326 RepID=A0A1I7SCK2_BURXY|nr:unnamed protein product [Bursaphelenchus xylophilus]CAG9093956.1 unnamed protein product [Bursaphelenchus xylophilus]